MFNFWNGLTIQFYISFYNIIHLLLRESYLKILLLSLSSTTSHIKLFIRSIIEHNFNLTL